VKVPAPYDHEYLLSKLEVMSVFFEEDVHKDGQLEGDGQ
jgi:hypothetical protein